MKLLNSLSEFLLGAFLAFVVLAISMLVTFLAS